jgi:hypothetical protein
VSTSPSHDEFLSTARRKFGFLDSDFGFTEQRDSVSPNPFSVTYLSSTAAVSVEGIQWGFGVQVILTCLQPVEGILASVPLWAVVKLRAPDETHVASGQLAQLGLDASLLRRYAADILSGDFTVFSAAMRVVEQFAQDTKRV